MDFSELGKKTLSVCSHSVCRAPCDSVWTDIFLLKGVYGNGLQDKEDTVQPSNIY